MSSLEQFSLKGKVAVITGGAGLLGVKHSEAIADAGGIPVIWDINEKAALKRAAELQKTHNTSAAGMRVDITDPESIRNALEKVLEIHKKVAILINNAASDSKVENPDRALGRLESYPLESWNKEIAVGLTGAFLCSQIVGSHMATSGGGVILNIASDLSIISPDQRIYLKKGVAQEKQQVKPVTYSVVKHGLVGLTKYLSTYWASQGVRANAISPGGIYNDKLPAEFVERLTNLIPMGRMAHSDEYKAAVVFLCSDASAYMTGHNLVMDGGRSIW